MVPQQHAPRPQRVQEQLAVIRSKRDRRRRAARWGWFLVVVVGSVPLVLLLRALDYDWTKFLWAVLFLYLFSGAWIVVLWPLPNDDEDDST